MRSFSGAGGRASLRTLLDEPEFADFHNAGLVIQAYLQDSSDDFERLLAWAKARDRRITIRLVKGVSVRGTIVDRTGAQNQTSVVSLVPQGPGVGGRAASVDASGQFAIRGGILDIYSFGNDKPYRVELFGNDVDSIRIVPPRQV